MPTMLLSTLSAFLLLLLLQSALGFFPYSGHTGRAPVCTSPSKPCRLRITMGDYGTDNSNSLETQTCSCSAPHVCPSDWTTAGQVVTRKVVSITTNITLEMMFCQAVEPKRLCSRRDISLDVKGSLTLPQDIEEYRCRCRRRQPLVLYRRRIGDDHLWYHMYKCANHVRLCPRQMPCITTDPVRTTYNCKCRSPQQCVMQPYAQGHDLNDVTYGYCQTPVLGDY